jgi:3',5'-cyclic AMP phosphodiesterase CpdA
LNINIVQLSDLHVDGLFKEEAFNTIIKEVNDLSPDVIIISGDLTDDGLIFQFQQAMSVYYIVQLIFWKNIGIVWQREAKKPAE